MQTVHHWREVPYLLSGKTIIGALLGGTLAVELARRHLGIRRRTGDLFALPITIGIAIGRIGCFLAGKQDDPMEPLPRCRGLSISVTEFAGIRFSCTR